MIIGEIQMPQHASAKKRMATNERDRARNRAVKSQVHRTVKSLKEAIGNPEAAAQLAKTHSVLDKASKKGILHPRKVDRTKSRLAKAVQRGAAK
jgi:small subunit ribosomal protein S20